MKFLREIGGVCHTGTADGDPHCVRATMTGTVQDTKTGTSSAGRGEVQCDSYQAGRE